MGSGDFSLPKKTEERTDMYGYEAKEMRVLLDNLLALCQEMNVGTVAGPVMSGAAIASALAGFACARGVPLQAIMLTKKGGCGEYVPSAHWDKAKHAFIETRAVPVERIYRREERLIIVDDIIASGRTLIESIKEIRERYHETYYNYEIVGVAISTYHKDALKGQIGSKLEDVGLKGVKFWDWDPSTRKAEWRAYRI